MKKSLVFITLFSLFFSCGKTEDTGTCIASCNPSTPGKINIAIENHSDLDISNISLTINQQATSFRLLPKSRQGNYSCWKSFDEIEMISLIAFNIGTDSSFSKVLNYENLARKREYSIDIQLINDAFRIQLVENPDCLEDAD